MSASYVVVVASGGERPTLRNLDAFGPVDEDEADALAARLRKDFALGVVVLRLRGWTEDAVRT